MKTRWMTCVAVVSVAMTACGSRPPAAAAEPAGEPATVRFVQVETGCWVIETKTARVQPVELAEEFRVDGLEVNVVLGDAPPMMGVCQVGPYKAIEKISKR
jgi:hypothetical protein